MSEEVEVGMATWKVFTSLLGSNGLLWFFGRRTLNRMDSDVMALQRDVGSLQKSDQDCKLDLANFKTEVARDYAKDQSVQQSLARLHDRLDDGFAELRTDIKALIKNGHL